MHRGPSRGHANQSQASYPSVQHRAPALCSKLCSLQKRQKLFHFLFILHTCVCIYIYIERERYIYVYRIHVYTCFFHLPVSIDLPFPRQNWDKFEADAKGTQPLLPALAGWEDSLKTATQRSIEGMIPYTCKRPLLKETFLNTATSRDLWPGRQPADFARA